MDEIGTVGWIKIVGMALTTVFLLYLLKVLVNVIKEDKEGKTNKKCDLD